MEFEGANIVRQSALGIKVEFEYKGQKVAVWFPRTKASVKDGVLEVGEAFWRVKKGEVDFTLTKGNKSLKKAVFELNALKNAKGRYIESLITHLGDNARAIQEKLYGNILDKYISRLQTKDGRVVFNERNINTVNEMTAAVERMGTFSETTLKAFAEDLISVSYIDSGAVLGLTDEVRLDRAINALDVMADRIGATVAEDGAVTIVEGGALQKLAGSTEVADKIAKYATANIGSGAGYDSYVKGLSEIVKGAEDAEGVLERYYRTYAYDSYSQASATADNYIAEQLDLNHFVYQGDEIDTTRPFCSERVGGVYSREDGESWNSQDWAGKIPGVDFFVQRGGYNCRHELNWITEEAANELM